MARFVGLRVWGFRVWKFRFEGLGGLGFREHTPECAKAVFKQCCQCFSSLTHSLEYSLTNSPTHSVK